MYVRAVAIISAVIWAAACSDSSGPKNNNGKIVTGGSNQTDTIGAILPLPLKIHTKAHAAVEFQTISDSCPVYTLLEGGGRLDVVDTTDSNGDASVSIQLGTRTGTARIAIGIRFFPQTDTARFTVQPGVTNSIVISPPDTAAYLNHGVTLGAVAVDRAGNHRSDAVSLRVASGPATLSGMTVTGTAYGRVVVLGTAATVTDTAYLSVVPQGTLAVNGDGISIVVFNLDGSNYQTLSGIQSNQVRWSPDGTHLVYDFVLGELVVTDLAGHRTAIDSLSPYFDSSPVYSRDGQWIYFSRSPVGTEPGFNSSLWRIHPDGTGVESVPSQDAGSMAFPSPSPDGTKLAYVADPLGQATVRVMTIATGAFQSLNVISTDPAWAPTGNTIAAIIGILAPDPIGLLDAGGGPGGPLTDPVPYLGGFDWSPDGQWIVAANPNTQRIELINVATRMVLPLAYTFGRGFTSPTWKP